ncbi:MAG: TauD/TfdA family dioxygenase, partial [Cyanobacteria bacterium P01_G01_bin.38]
MPPTNRSNAFPGRSNRRRQPVSLDAASLVQVAPLQPDSALPLLVQPTLDNLNLAHWVQHHGENMTRWLHHHGGILFRGFQVQGVEDFQTFIQTVAYPPLPYTYRSTPRTQVRGPVYTSTEYPANRTIPLHNEMAYARQWPLRIAFYCPQPAASGGETPIADSRRVLARIDPTVRSRFQAHGVLYIRNYGGGLDLPWQEVFQTEQRQVVETYCHQAQIEFTWHDHDQLQTRQICQAIAPHPHTGESVWFNQAHLFHLNTLDPTLRAQLLATMAADRVPRHTRYGDGTEITTAVLDRIHQAYTAETVTFPWQAGDVLLLDNMLVAHGRRPFSGPRQVLAGMGDPWNSKCPLHHRGAISRSVDL